MHKFKRQLFYPLTLHVRAIPNKVNYKQNCRPNYSLRNMSTGKIRLYAQLEKYNNFT
jgi:hypothetical protein